MAAVSLKCTFFGYLTFYCALLVSTKANNDDFSISSIIKGNNILLERMKRYIENPIPRLADNYNRDDPFPSKTLDKDDLDTFSRRRGRMEMIGNMAISAEDLATAAAASRSGEEARREGDTVTERVPEKPTKKATSTVVKKPIDAGKVSVITDTLTDNTSENHTATSHPHDVSTDDIHIHNDDGNDNTSTGAHQDESHHSVTAGKPEETLVNEETDGISTSDNFSSDGYPKDITNNTLFKNNITDKQVDHHSYYNSTFITDPTIAKQYWVEMNSEKDVIVNKMLSKSHRRAATVKLSFDFPFYGHFIQKMTIATGGFLYTGDYIHAWLAATQYIAPLMANFDTGLSDESQVKYSDNGTSFTVEWNRVHLQDKKEAGQFSFQVTLHKNGDIIFVYKDVPILVEDIDDDQHPVKVGLSDAYIIDRTVFFVRRKTIYEYHRVNFKKEDIKNWTVIYLSALPTCLSHTDCNSCVNSDSLFGCKWCDAVGRCSSGFDRFSQQWQLNHCGHSAVNTTAACLAKNTTDIVERHHQHGRLYDVTSRDGTSDGAVNSQAATDLNLEKNTKSSHFGHSGLLGLLFFILAISGLGMWLLYAYRNPHTTSGQVLIRYRPSQWTLRRGEARYTAATIHM